MTFWLLIRQTRYRSAHEKEKRNNKNSGLRYACNKVPWSKGQDTGLSSRRYWVQVPWGSLRLLSLKVRTPASQAGNDGFKSRRSYCGYRTVAVKRTQFALQICGSAYGGFDSLWSHYGWVCLAARAADCKSVTEKHRRFESCPIHFPFACPSGLWCHPAKVVCGNAPKVQILPQTLLTKGVA